MKSTTARTLALLKEEGYTAQSVEKYNSFSKTHNDLFGGIDVLAIRGKKTLGIQCTTSDNVAARVKKLKGLKTMKIWLFSGSERGLEVWGWKKYKNQKGKRPMWKVRVVEFFLSGRTGKILSREVE